MAQESISQCNTYPMFPCNISLLTHRIMCKSWLSAIFSIHMRTELKGLLQTISESSHHMLRYYERIEKIFGDPHYLKLFFLTMLLLFLTSINVSSGTKLISLFFSEDMMSLWSDRLQHNLELDLIESPEAFIKMMIICI